MAKNKTEPDECLWERQEGETEGAWEAFLTYRNMEGKRTVLKVAKKLAKSRQQITKWKSLWFWDDRVRAYDNTLERASFDEEINERREMNKRHIAISSKLQKFALEALELKNPKEVSVKEIKEYLKIATDLERLARNGLIESYAKGDEFEATDNDVVIYIPDNGMRIEDE